MSYGARQRIYSRGAAIAEIQVTARRVPEQNTANASRVNARRRANIDPNRGAERRASE